MDNKFKRALYAFSGDPITYGHIDIIRRAANVFDEVVVGIGVNPGKSYLFSLEERKEMARISLEALPNVKVVSFEGLLVDYAYEHGISVIIKGVRNTADFDYENALHLIGESQKLGIDTHILFARPDLAHVSSSNVKAIQKEQGFIHEYVPLTVKQSLEAKVSGQYVLGITGEIGSGKSHLGRKFEEWARVRGVEVHNIELDTLGHDILEKLEEPVYREIRESLATSFGRHILGENGRVSRKKLGDIVFAKPEALKKLNETMATPLLVRIRRELYGRKGLVLLNAALIAESEMSYLCNNNLVLVRADKKVQEERLIKRNLTPEQIERRLASQYSFEEKKNQLEERIREDHWGRLWIWDSSTNPPVDELEKLFVEVVENLGLPTTPVHRVKEA